MLLPLSSRQLGGACCCVRQHAVLRRWVSNITPAAAVASNSDLVISTPAMGLLSSVDLQQYIARHNIQASLVAQPAAVAPSQVIKSMVLLIKDANASTQATATAAVDTSSSTSSTDLDTSPDSAATGSVPAAGGAAAAAAAVLVLLTEEVLVDEHAVAQQLALPRRRLRLASRQEAAAVTGYEVGSIPPFGHLQPLRTLVDVSITRQLAAPQQQQQQPFLYAGGGAPDLQLLLSAQQLVAATAAAETGVFSAVALKAAAAVQQPFDKDSQQQQQQQQQQRWAAQLPLPWPAGSSEVELIGVVAQRRRIAKLLLFCSLVPESVPPLPADGTAAYVRRLWRHPDADDMPCEVQVIMGKTIERDLGRDEAAALMDHIKVGSVVSVKGRVQQKIAATKVQALSSSSSSSSSSSRRVHDVVAHEVLLLHKNRDMLAKAIRKAQRQGAADVKTAAQLLQLQQQQEQQQQDQQGNGHVQRTSEHSEQPQQRRFKTTGNGVGAGSSSTASSYELSGTAGSSSNGSTVRSQSAAMRQAAEAASSSPPAAAAAGSTSDDAAQRRDTYWQLPADIARRIHWVCDEQGIAAMQQLVLPRPHEHNSSSSCSSSSSSGVPGTVVGLDCEWRPFERSSQATPVALLQLATRQHVFLVDLLAVCQQQQQQPDPCSNSSSSSDVASNSSSSSSSSRGGVTPAEEALSSFLLSLLCDPRVVKVGFQLATDLDRLQQSYPHLPCFQPGAAAAAGFQPTHAATGASRLACYLDLLHLARAAVPSIVKLPHMSLSKLVELLLGKPLDKAEQRSAWDARPLSDAQLQYAAKDAYVLTVLFDAVLGHLPDGVPAGLLEAVGDKSLTYLPVSKDASEAGAAVVVEPVVSS